MSAAAVSQALESVERATRHCDMCELAWHREMRQREEIEKLGIISEALSASVGEMYRQNMRWRGWFFLCLIVLAGMVGAEVFNR